MANNPFGGGFMKYLAQIGRPEGPQSGASQPAVDPDTAREQARARAEVNNWGAQTSGSPRQGSLVQAYDDAPNGRHQTPEPQSFSGDGSDDIYMLNGHMVRAQRQGGQLAGVRLTPEEEAAWRKQNPGRTPLEAAPERSPLEAAPAGSGGTLPGGLAALMQQPGSPQPGGIAAPYGVPAQPPPPSYSGMGSSNPTPVLGNHERDRMQQDGTADADAWWRNRGNY